jgi:hypothetical protein
MIVRPEISFWELSKPATSSRDAELFLEATLSCVDGTLQVLAWPVKAQMMDWS